MLIDAELLFSENQAITATANSTNALDLLDVRDIGTGQDLFVFVSVTQAFTDTGSDSTVTVSLVTDDNASLSSPATVRTFQTFPALTGVGTHYFQLPIPTTVDYQRYIGLTYTVAGGNLTTGKFTAGIVAGVQKTKNYPSGYTL